MTENKIIGWLEAVSNRQADKWMRGRDRSLLLRGFFVRPEELMDRRYLLRWAGWAFVTFAAAIFFADAFMFLMDILMLPPIDRRYHILVPSLGSMLASSVHILIIHWLMYLLMTFGGFLLLMTIMSMRAYFWNRRARRLQATPTAAEPTIASPGVWPPAPRIS